MVTFEQLNAALDTMNRNQPGPEYNFQWLLQRVVAETGAKIMIVIEGKPGRYSYDPFTGESRLMED